MLRELGREIRGTAPEGVGFALFAEGLYLANGERSSVADAVREWLVERKRTPPPLSAEDGTRPPESPSFHASRLALERYCVDVARSLAAEWGDRPFIFFAFDLGPAGGRLAWKAHSLSATLDETLRCFVERYASPEQTPPAPGRPTS